MLTNLAFVFICVRASSALVRTSAFLQPVVRGQVYICDISPPLIKRYHYFKIKPPNALFVEVHTMFTHMHIKMQLV